MTLEGWFNPHTPPNRRNPAAIWSYHFMVMTILTLFWSPSLMHLFLKNGVASHSFPWLLDNDAEINRGNGLCMAQCEEICTLRSFWHPWMEKSQFGTLSGKSMLEHAKMKELCQFSSASPRDDEMHNLSLASFTSPWNDFHIYWRETCAT